MADYQDIHEKYDANYPMHGWVKNTSGARLLCLPVISLYGGSNKHHKYFSDNKIDGFWLQTHSPQRTLTHLAVCFRDLHKEIREILPLVKLWDKEQSHERNIGLTRLNEGQKRSEVLLIAAFTLLRRLADELINASRPFLFNHWQSAPREMKKAIPASKEGELEKLSPICDLDILQNALENHTSWLDKLRADQGVRNILVHRPHTLNIHHSGSKKNYEDRVNWRVSADLMQYRKGKPKVTELFSCLVECVDEACKFMELLCMCVNLEGSYNRNKSWSSGLIFITGKDNDIVGFWPPVGCRREEFPILD